MLTALRQHVLIAVVGVAALLLSTDVAAQVAAVGSLTMQAAINRALAANPTIAAARLRGPINLANLAVARERLNPEASIELEKETPKEAYGMAVPFELGGKRTRRIEVAEATIRAGDAELAATIAQVRNDVRRAYFGQMVAEQRLTILREQRDISIRTLDTAQARLDAGDVPRLEVMQAELALAAVENEATAAEGHLHGGACGVECVARAAAQHADGVVDDHRRSRTADHGCGTHARADGEHGAHLARSAD
jgi:cobalt-zinc-cadmium efflux system outer membrane protein